MDDLIGLQSLFLMGPQTHPLFQGFGKMTSPLHSSIPLRHLNNQSAILADGNAAWRMAWLEVIIHL